MLLRNKEAFRLWARLGLQTMFLGLEAIDAEGLKKYRKRVMPLDRNFEAVEFARSLGVNVAVNLIADPDWDHERFRIVREWCPWRCPTSSISASTPLIRAPRAGSPTGCRLETRDYRLFDIQHAVLPTKLPLDEFYRELVSTQRAIMRKHLDWHQLWDAGGIVAGLLLRGQTNFVRSLFKLNKVYRPELLLADHMAPGYLRDAASAAARSRTAAGPCLAVRSSASARLAAGARSTPRPKNSSRKPAWGARYDRSPATRRCRGSP